MKNYFNICLLVGIVLALAYFFSVPPTTKAKELDLEVRLNGETIIFPDAQPFVDKNGRTQIPVRFIAEGMGAKVGWDEETQTVTIVRGAFVIILKIGEAEIIVSGKKKQIDTVPILKDARAFVPLRFVSEALGAGVSWSSDDKMGYVLIGDNNEDFNNNSNTTIYDDDNYYKDEDNLNESSDKDNATELNTTKTISQIYVWHSAIGHKMGEYRIDLNKKEFWKYIPENNYAERDPSLENEGFTFARQLEENKIENFLKQAEEQGFTNWKEYYTLENMLDGHQWGIVITFSDTSTKNINGSNAYPETYDYMKQAFIDLVGESVL